MTDGFEHIVSLEDRAKDFVSKSLETPPTVLSGNYEQEFLSFCDENKLDQNELFDAVAVVLQGLVRKSRSKMLRESRHWAVDYSIFFGVPLITSPYLMAITAFTYAPSRFFIKYLRGKVSASNFSNVQELLKTAVTKTSSSGAVSFAGYMWLRLCIKLLHHNRLALKLKPRGTYK